jgi:hypothetical protein
MMRFCQVEEGKSGRFGGADPNLGKPALSAYPCHYLSFASTQSAGQNRSQFVGVNDRSSLDQIDRTDEGFGIAGLANRHLQTTGPIGTVASNTNRWSRALRRPIRWWRCVGWQNQGATCAFSKVGLGRESVDVWRRVAMLESARGPSQRIRRMIKMLESSISDAL